jgi:DNA-binding NarL/FixJ family response regulator
MVKEDDTKLLSIIIADDHPMILEGLRKVLEGRYNVIDTVANGEQLISSARKHRPDIVILDISMPVMTGLEACRQLHPELTDTKFIFVTMHTDSYFMNEAFDAGASAYVSKQSAGVGLLAAIDAIQAGERYITPGIGSTHPAVPAAGRSCCKVCSSLTDRQAEVLRLIALGSSMKLIAAELGISVRTVESHKYTLMERIGVSSTAALVQYAVRHGVTKT